MPQNSRYDPVYLRALREAVIVLIVWFMGLLWTCGYCFVAAYDVPADQIRLILGMPGWVFWGVLLPWVIIIGFSIWFGLFYISRDELVCDKDESGSVQFQEGSEPEKGIT